MKKYTLFICLLSFSLSISAQSLRRTILNADLIVVGYPKFKDIKTGSDYYNSESYLKISELLKGNYNTDSLVKISFSTELYEIDEEPVKWLYFLKKDGDYFYVTRICTHKLKDVVQEMLEIDKIKEPEKRFSETVEWMIRILENYAPLEFCDYNDLDEHSDFYRYYKEKGLISNIDSILNPQQKQRVANKLFKMHLWDYPESDFASLIYKDYLEQTEQHVLKMMEEYFAHAKYISFYDIGKMLRALKNGPKAKAVEAMQKKIEEEEDKSTKKIITEITLEFEQLLKNP